MATDYRDELQLTLYTTLSAALAVDVYDGGAPSAAVMPYVTFDTFTEAPRDPLNSRRTECFVMLSAWSDARGRMEVSGIVADIDAALHRAKLTMGTGRFIRSYVTRKHIVPDIGGETFVGKVTVRALYEH